MLYCHSNIRIRLPQGTCRNGEEQEEGTLRGEGIP